MPQSATSAWLCFKHNTLPLGQHTEVWLGQVCFLSWWKGVGKRKRDVVAEAGAQVALS